MSLMEDLQNVVDSARDEFKVDTQSNSETESIETVELRKEERGEGDSYYVIELTPSNNDIMNRFIQYIRSELSEITDEEFVISDKNDHIVCFRTE